MANGDLVIPIQFTEEVILVLNTTKYRVSEGRINIYKQSTYTVELKGKGFECDYRTYFHSISYIIQT